MILNTLYFRCNNGVVIYGRGKIKTINNWTWREIWSLLKAMDEFKIKEGLIITEEYNDIKEINNKRIVFKPLWQWLIL